MQDIQRTLLEFTAITISDQIKLHSHVTQISYVCGGGALNPLLMLRLATIIRKTITLQDTNALKH